MANDPVITINGESGSVIMIFKDPETRLHRLKVIWTPEQASMIGRALIEMAEKALKVANAKPNAEPNTPDGQ